jgi:hypothetical protein
MECGTECRLVGVLLEVRSEAHADHDRLNLERIDLGTAGCNIGLYVDFLHVDIDESRFSHCDVHAGLQRTAPAVLRNVERRRKSYVVEPCVIDAGAGVGADCAPGLK